MRYNEIINELFDKSAELNLVDAGTGKMVANFSIGKKRYTVFAAYWQSSGLWEIGFTHKGSFGMTGTGNEFEVFATVKKFLGEFINLKQPEKFKFSADLSEASRVRLYDRLATQVAAAYGYKLTVSTTAIDKVFTFNKETVAEQTQLVTELFDKAAQWQVETNTAKYFSAAFNIGDGKYTVEANHTNKTWQIVFARNGDYKATSTGNEFEVFATIKAIVNDFVTKKQPTNFQFSAASDEPTRIRLYDRMAKGLSDQHGYKLERKAGDGGIYYIFTKPGQNAITNVLSNIGTKK